MSTLKTNEIQTIGGKKILGSSGSIVQTTQIVFTSVWSSVGQTATSFSDVTGYTASIIPSSSSNKILAMFQMHLGFGYWEVQGRITRNGNGISASYGTPRGTRPAASFCAQNYDGQSSFGYNWITIGYNYLDSPATTSNVTYGIQLNGYQTYQLHLNRTGQDTDSSGDYYGCPASTITLMEVTA